MKRLRAANLRPPISGVWDATLEFVRTTANRNYSVLEGIAAFVQQFDDLTRPVFTRESTGTLYNSGLCIDGQPLELSLSAGRRSIDFRFVIDTTDPNLTAQQRWQAYRRFADQATPNFEDRRTLLDFLFAAHQHDSVQRNTFQVWHGVGYSDEIGPTGKLYFNTAWLTKKDLAGIIGRVTNRMSGSGLMEIVEESGVDFVSYDFTQSGLESIKTYRYFSSSTLSEVQAILARFDDSDWLSTIAGQLRPTAIGTQTGNYYVRTAYDLDGRLKKTGLDFDLGCYGIRRFDELTPIFESLSSVCVFKDAFADSFREVENLYQPTIFTIANAEDDIALSVYFRPILENTGKAVRCLY